MTVSYVGMHKLFWNYLFLTILERLNISASSQSGASRSPQNLNLCKNCQTEVNAMFMLESCHETNSLRRLAILWVFCLLYVTEVLQYVVSYYCFSNQFPHLFLSCVLNFTVAWCTTSNLRCPPALASKESTRHSSSTRYPILRIKLSVQINSTKGPLLSPNIKGPWNCPCGLRKTGLGTFFAVQESKCPSLSSSANSFSQQNLIRSVLAFGITFTFSNLRYNRSFSLLWGHCRQQLV